MNAEKLQDDFHYSFFITNFLFEVEGLIKENYDVNFAGLEKYLA